MDIKKLYSKPLTIYEIDLLHYKSIRSDKEYFVDALILKAIDKHGKKIFNSSEKEKLLNYDKAKLERMYLEMFSHEIANKSLH